MVENFAPQGKLVLGWGQTKSDSVYQWQQQSAEP